MRILLVFPLYRYKSFEENISVVSDEFGAYPPISLAYLAAVLEKKGHVVSIIDANALGYSAKDVFLAAKKFNPDYVLVSLHSTYMFHSDYNIIKYIKKRLDIPIIVGGVNFSLYPKEIISYPEIDYGFVGPGHDSIVHFLDAIKSVGISREAKMSKINGLVYKSNSKIIINPQNTTEVNLEKMPFPARHLLPNDKYYQFISKKKNFTIMLVSTGCPFSCVFCPMQHTKYVIRKAEHIVDEMEECYNKYGIKEIDFFDALFTFNKKTVLGICSEIKRRNLKIDWSCRSRIDTVDEEMLKAMANAGCKRIYYGIESADESILKKIHKNIPLKEVPRVIAITRRYGIKALGFFIIGNPGETEASIRKMIRFAKKLNLDYVQFSRLIAKPASELYQEYVTKTNDDYWKEFIEGKQPEKRLKNIWSNLSEKQIEKWTRKAYLSFYMRPSYIFKTIMAVDSFDELLRYIKAGFKMVFLRSKL